MSGIAKSRRIVGFGLASAFLAGVLVSLGVWQLHRLTWKERILAEIARAEREPGLPLGPSPSPFEKVSVRGVWRERRAVLYGDTIRNTPAGPVRGADLVMLLDRAGRPSVVVDLGWVQEIRPRAPALQAGEVTVSGFVVAPERAGLFSARDDPKQGLFYTLDPQAIGKALRASRVAPFTLMVMGRVPVGATPIPRRHLPHPPNDHLQYALTWFGLAIVVLAQYGFWVRQEWRS